MALVMASYVINEGVIVCPFRVITYACTDLNRLLNGNKQFAINMNIL